MSTNGRATSEPAASKKADQRGLDVTIMGREYRVACKPEEERDLLDAVAFVDGQMREIRDALKQNNAERIAVMTALNIANELLRLRSGGGIAGDASAARGPTQNSPETDIDLSAVKRRIQSMQSTIDASLAEQERLL